MQKFSRNVLVSGELLIQDTNLKPIKEEAFGDFEDSQRQSFLSRNLPVKKFSKKSIVGLIKIGNEVEPQKNLPQKEKESVLMNQNPILNTLPPEP